MTHPFSIEEKLELAGKVGNDLAQHFGKKKYYSEAMINAAARRRGIAAGSMFWAYALQLDEFEPDGVSHFSWNIEFWLNCSLPSA